MILRYDSAKLVFTRLDPLTDIISWFEGLRSKGFAADLLKEIHGIHDKEKINSGSKAVACHANNAINLLEQAFSGSTDVSFLPIYYALLNISKIYIIFRGKHAELEKQRYHGAGYKPKNRRDLMTDEITLHKLGAIPLYFETITNNTLVASNKLILHMNDIYPYIRDISHEYSEIYKSQPHYRLIDINIEGADQSGYRLKAGIANDKVHLQKFSKSYVKVLGGFDLVPNIRKTGKGKVINLTGVNSYITKWVKDTKENAERALITQYLKRYLLSVNVHGNSFQALTPLSCKSVILPEEMPILLAFFHMSNIVRYNPDMLEQLKDSKTWSLLIALKNHGTLAFLELSWSAIQQSHIKITRV